MSRRLGRTGGWEGQNGTAQDRAEGLKGKIRTGQVVRTAERLTVPGLLITEEGIPSLVFLKQLFFYQ